MNKFGDMFFYMFMVLSYSFYKTFDFYLLFSLVGADVTTTDLIFLNINKIDILAISLVIAAIGKSAQLGLHSWLPDAMEGPTPVSALLHSATMVTAGIFLIIRCSFIIENSILALKILSFVGIFTSVFSSIIAMGQYDIKKSIAYSTTGQLAYMLGSCGASQYYDAFQHLINHAFFKAVLFLTAGAIIHSSVNGVQDIRDLGKFLFKSPVILVCFLISSLSLMGVSGTSGFYSKESIIESFFLKDNFDAFLSSLSAASVALSAYYSLQLFLLIFLDNDKSLLKNYNIESS
jgi:NADH:ubiquinone oxidoreductase subunit 5 (subunit L)/multisubunit Na+/H+ antiporter MnhA subunit